MYSGFQLSNHAGMIPIETKMIMTHAVGVTLNYRHHAAALVRHFDVVHASHGFILQHASLTNSVNTHRCPCMVTILYNKKDAGVVSS